MKKRKFNKGGNILGGLTGLAGSLIGAYNNVNPLDQNTINQARQNAYTVGNTAFGTSSMSGLMDQYNNQPQLQQLSAQDIYDPSSKERFSQLFGAGYGAYQGTQALTDNFNWDNIKKEASQKANGGYIDSIINLAGAGLGMGLNAISNAVQKRKAEEAAQRQNILNDFALNRQNHNFNIAVEDTKNNMFNNQALQMMADGGSIYIKPNKRGTFTEAAKRRGLGVQEFASRVLANKENYSPAMIKKTNFSRNAAKWHAFGGNLSTQGSDWTNGLNWINNGGTHEANPQDGVPMGIAPDGKPNLVEEGEVIFNDDYVFSNRLKVPKMIRDKYKLKDDITFAEAIKKLSKESEERPNDPISQDGLDVFINDLTASQEEVRMKKQTDELKQQIANMSPEELQGLQQLMQQQGGEQPVFAFGGYKFEEGGDKESQKVQRYIEQLNNDQVKALLNALQVEYTEKGDQSDNRLMRELLANSLGKTDQYQNLTNAVRNLIEGVKNKNEETEYIQIGKGINTQAQDFINTLSNYEGSMIPGNLPGTYRPDNSIDAAEIEKSPAYQKFKQIWKDMYNNGTDEEKKLALQYFNQLDARNVGDNKMVNEDGTINWDTYDKLNYDKLGGVYHMYDRFKDPLWERTVYRINGQEVEYDSNNPNAFYNIAEGNDEIDDEGKVTHVYNLTPYVFKNPETTEVSELKEQETLPTWLRYAPVVGSGIGSLISMTQEPKDYSTNVPFRQSTFEPIGDYLTYQPVDTQKYINAANQQAAAQRDAILNASSGNRAQALANMAAANYTNQQGIAALMNQAEQINWPRQVQASEFNRGTNQFNAQAFNQSSQANMALNNLRLNQAQQNANLRRAEDLARDEAISSNLSNLFTNLGNIGTENFNMNMVNENPALYYGLTGRGDINYKRKDGGLLTKKNRRK